MNSIKNKVFSIGLLLLASPTMYAMTDMTVYALSNGTYQYKTQNYTLHDFPIEQVLEDASSGGSAPTVDSVAPVTVEIFPVDNLAIEDLRALVRPLAIKFHRRGAKVNTRFLNKVIPYLFKKKEFFEN